jgi:hypothetical protein
VFARGLRRENIWYRTMKLIFSNFSTLLYFSRLNCVQFSNSPDSISLNHLEHTEAEPNQTAQSNANSLYFQEISYRCPPRRGFNYGDT